VDPSARLSKGQITAALLKRRRGAVACVAVMGLVGACTVGVAPFAVFLTLIEWIEGLWPTPDDVRSQSADLGKSVMALSSWLFGAYIVGCGAQWCVASSCFASHVSSPRCMACGYDARGLTPVDGWITCPECARATPVTRAAVWAAPRSTLPARKGRAVVGALTVTTLMIAVPAIMELTGTTFGFMLDAGGQLGWGLIPIEDQDRAAFTVRALLGLCICAVWLGFVLVALRWIHPALEQWCAGWFAQRYRPKRWFRKGALVENSKDLGAGEGLFP
jgi:hypothetical protein